jgi:uncharacterized protein (TIGR02594 family)
VTILEKGSSGDSVTRLQRLLNAILRPRPRLSEDGDFGAKTFEAVLRFQKLHGLKADGMVGPQTWTALGLKMAPATPPTAQPTASTCPWMKKARAELELDVQALPGEEHNPKIIDYFDATTYQPGNDETPWCSAFVNWVMEQSGHPGTRSAAAVSWLEWGKSLSSPTEGAVAVIHYKARDKKIEGCKPMTTGSGNHVAFYVRSSGTHIYLLGGNQGHRVSEVGFPFKCWDVKGYRWPR